MVVEDDRFSRIAIVDTLELAIPSHVDINLPFCDDT
jgi:hypothetical protein